MNVETSNSIPSYIVGIGASAGGLEAIESFFDNMPADTGMAFVVVQHLSPDFKSLMDELLARHTNMEIHPVEEGMVVRANRVYLIPPRKNMVLRDGCLRLTEQNKEARGLNLPIDIFFDSLAEDAPNRAIAVVLSGTGSDGSRGLQRIHESGGLVLGQSAATAGFDGMPKSAKATGMVDVVTSPALMPASILQYLKQPAAFPRGVEDEDFPHNDGDELATLFRTLRRKFGIDFSRYRSTTTNRRIDRRIQITQSETLEKYLQRIDLEPGELDILFRDLLVEVTQFFRDAPAFLRIRNDVIPNLLRNCKPDGQLRIWVPACATGEEAYSIAMIAHRCQASMPDRSDVDIKVFATDVHQTSLEIASSGVYSFDTAQTLPAEYRDDYLTRAQDLFHVNSAIRQLVIFAPHDITSDPPFTKMDLISCRNALIYLNPDVQKLVIALFHFGLRVGGYLFLGPSESLSDAADEFEVIDTQWRIFSKIRDVRLTNSENQSYSQPLRKIVRSRAAFVATATKPVSNWLIPEVHEELLREYVPPSLLIDSFGSLVHSFGNAKDYLQQPEGKATLDVLRMVNSDLRMALSSALHRARSEHQPVVLNSVPISIGGEQVQMRIKAKPYKKGNEELVLVSLEQEAGKPKTEQNENVIDVSPDGYTAERIVSLERELAYLKESLKSTVEQLETSNEELQSTNEELVASNEELQSTNEELHSVNEELHTVNVEHQLKIQELIELTSDMDNLLLSTQIGTIFLDKELRIRKFTPAIGEAFYMLQQDVGRPIEHIASKLDVPDLHKEVREVLHTSQPLEREARNRDGKIYLLRIQPYNGAGETVSGVVLTCVDISAILSSYEEIRRAAAMIELSDRDLQEFAYAVSHDLQAPLRHIVSHTRQLRASFMQFDGTDAAESFAAINSSVAKLETMIVGLLRYARIYSRGQPFVTANLSDLLEQAIRSIQVLIDDSGAIIKQEPLPELLVDPEQMTMVFQQLIVNAITYAREMPPRMFVTATSHETYWQIEFTDNGIGIAPQHREHVFRIFERLEFRSAPGDGMGLALCRRIMQRHGGNISAHASSIGNGTTIRIRLPIKPESDQA